MTQSETLPQVGHQFVAFTGYSRTGKDTAAECLMARGYRRLCFGDIIKKQLDSAIQKRYGFSAFTQVDAEKKQIRHHLESHGDLYYDEVMSEFFRDVAAIKGPVVNTRLCRGKEAAEWRNMGGILIRLKKSPYIPHTPWEVETDREVDSYVTHEIYNNFSVDVLHDAVAAITMDTNFGRMFLVELDGVDLVAL